MSRVKNWMSSISSSNQDSNPDQSGSHNSRLSRTLSRLNKLAISAPMNSSSGSGDTKLIIQQTESFELTEKSQHDGGLRSGDLGKPDYYHF